MEVEPQHNAALAADLKGRERKGRCYTGRQGVAAAFPLNIRGQGQQEQGRKKAFLMAVVAPLGYHVQGNTKGLNAANPLFQSVGVVRRHFNSERVQQLQLEIVGVLHADHLQAAQFQIPPGGLLLLPESLRNPLQGIAAGLHPALVLEHQEKPPGDCLVCSKIGHLPDVVLR